MIEKDSTGTFKIPAASHKGAEPQSEPRRALANMLRAILKVKAGAERESYNPLNYSPDDFVSRQKVGAALKRHSAIQLDQPVGYSMQSIKRRHLNRRARNKLKTTYWEMQKALNTKTANGLSAIPSEVESKRPLIIPLCGKT